ncbi:hypothetical protein Tco_0907086 [Tanacetum coccineum]|uniref:Uncharacterized protein n=1 Tax=Tanacetum coccineum TaxID=301880 RepID=A0ABQ5CIA5_9ASTR
MVDEILRQRCTSGDEHQYHIDQMKNFLKSDIVGSRLTLRLHNTNRNKETREKERIRFPIYLTSLSLINQDLLYLKKGSSRPEKIVLSLHKFPAIIFNDVDIEERTSRRVNKCVKKFNPYARYGVEHWKNPHAKIFYIKMQKEPGKPKEGENGSITEIVIKKSHEVPDYAETNLTEDEVEYFKLFEEEIEVRLKYRNQMRRWEMYVNGRPFGPRRKRPE